MLTTSSAAIVINNEDKFEVTEILDKQKRGKKVEYLVSWKGYGPEDDTWEPASGMKNTSELVDKFNQKYPEADKVYKKTRRLK